MSEIITTLVGAAIMFITTYVMMEIPVKEIKELSEATTAAAGGGVVWTAREAMACAYCWSEFNDQEKTGIASPEAYWLGITEAARNDCRRAANQKWLLAVARGQAVAITSPHMFTEDERAAIGAEVGIKAPSRIWKIILAVRNGAAKRSPPNV